jgi:DEAD/DEAH box helicase domain-containing protein
VFVIAASKNAFTKLGTTLEEFARGTVEPSHLYLENEIIQFQQACCLMDEIGGKEQIDEAMHLVDWPKGFGAAIGYAVPGADCPRGFNRPTKYAGGCAHLYFPLRRISDKNFKLRYANNPDQVIGQIGHEQALREAFAGATYIHNRNAYRVMEWKSIAFGQSIHVQPIVNGPPTRPIINRKVGFSLNSEDLLDGRYKSSSAGSLAETSIQVTESVLGYSVAGKDRMYRDIQADDRRMQIQTRTFETTGIVLQFSASALSGEGTAKTEKRSAIAKALRAILSLLHGIQLGEIGWAVSGVSRHDEFGPTKIDDAIIIFDDIKGGLRLTRPLYCDFRRVLGRLRVGAEKAGDECLLSQDMLEYLEHWFAGLELSVPLQQEHGSALGIFAPGSVVGAQVNGRLRLCKLLGHHYVEMSGSTMLMYEYEVSNGAKAWIAASALEPIGDQWKLLLSQEAQGGVK